MAKIPFPQDACPAPLSSRKCIPCEGGAAPLIRCLSGPD
jgi:hypothetical protein